MNFDNSVSNISTKSTDNSNNQADIESVKFYQLKLNKPILKALQASNYQTPTPIQAQAIPLALQGCDLLLSAQTGSGKTAAFVLPILDKLSRMTQTEKQVFALILTPTRELACQVHDSIRRYGSKLRRIFSLPMVGGSPYGGQIRALRKGVQIIVATPGRLLDHMNEGRVDLSQLQMLVLDEADRMLDMGFADDIKRIIDYTPKDRQTIMSSATWDGEVGRIAESFTKDPRKIAIKVESAHIDESVYFCDDFQHKNQLLLKLLADSDIKQAVIFTATKRSTETLTQMLLESNFRARYLHGDLPQGKRNHIVKQMKTGECDLLVATDVAARGIDISQISHVINYDLPRQVEDYVHRIGRCGRAGRTGVAINLCSRDDYKQLQQINRYLKRPMKAEILIGLEPKYTPAEKKNSKRKPKTSQDKSLDKARTSYRKKTGLVNRSADEVNAWRNSFSNQERSERRQNQRKHQSRSSDRQQNKLYKNTAKSPSPYASKSKNKPSAVEEIFFHSHKKQHKST